MNSWAMSTFDCSSELPMSVPRPPAPATPTLAMPGDAASPKRFDPAFTRPSGLLKLASAKLAHDDGLAGAEAGDNLSVESIAEALTSPGAAHSA